MLNLLRTHLLVVLGDRLVDNPFFIPVDELPEKSAGALT
jgi:hypothetical protein